MSTTPPNRRNFLTVTGLSALAVGMASATANAADTPAGVKVEPLPYAYDALEPFIDAETMQVHHNKHYQKYADELNKALQSHPDLSSQSPELLVGDLSKVPESIRMIVRNNGGGYVNHKMFWPQLKKNNDAKPGGELASAIDKKFGSFSGFQTEFTKAATGVFGSGWAWLAVSKAGDLAIVQTHNQDTPLSEGAHPVLGIDVWEHAYYLKYQNRRPEYIANFYKVINWDIVSSRYQELRRL